MFYLTKNICINAFLKPKQYYYACFYTSHLQYNDKYQSLSKSLKSVTSSSKKKQVRSTKTLVHSIDSKLESLSSHEDLENLINNPDTKLNDILLIDVRLLPSDLRMTCLEGVFKIYERTINLPVNRIHDDPLSLTLTSKIAWPKHYLKLEHHSRWNGWELGIKPLVGRQLVENNTETSWVNSKEFELLLLSTTASANKLPFSRLLSLAGILQYIWTRYDPKVYASVLHLITEQINESNHVQLVQIAHLIKNIIIDNSDQLLKPIIEQLDLVRRALGIHILSKRSRLESLGPIVLIRLLTDAHTYLTVSDQLSLLMSVESCLINNPQEWNLYTIVYLCVHLSRLKIIRRGLLNRFLGQLKRKLSLAHRNPNTNQSQWLNAALSAIANLCVQAPVLCDDEVKNLHNFITPPYFDFEKDLKQFSSSSIDAHELLAPVWVEHLFTDLAGHIATQNNSSLENYPHDISTQIFYSLSLLGYHSSILFDQLTNRKSETNNEKQKPEGPPFLLMSGLLSNSITQPLDYKQQHAVGWLPRADWQLYYHYVSLLRNKLKTNFQMIESILPDYVSLKKEPITLLLEHIGSRIRNIADLKIKTFQLIRLESDENTYFADILFEKQSVQNPSVTKYVICFLCWERDVMVKGPLDSFLAVYSQKQPIPIVEFNFSRFSKLNKGDQRNFSDRFLCEVAEKMKSFNGLSPSCLQTQEFFSVNQ